MLINDLPYNMTDVIWDTQITAKELTKMWSQVKGSNESETCVVVYMHKINDSLLIQNVLEEKCQVSDVIKFVWVKPKHQSSAPVTTLCNAMEIGTIGFHPNKEACNADLPKDPKDRPNVYIIPHITKFQIHESGSRKGMKVNHSEKPPALMRTIVSQFAKIGETVLIIGFGAGGDLIGAAEHCNVVAVEKDYEQFVHVVGRLMKYNADFERDKKKSLLEAKKNESSANELKNLGGGDDKSEDPGPGMYSAKCTECECWVSKEVPSTRVCEICENNVVLHVNCSVVSSDRGKYWCLQCSKLDGVAGSWTSDNNGGTEEMDST